MREAKYWLALVRLAEVLTEDVTNTIFKEAGELLAILSQAVITAKMRDNSTSNLKCRTSNLKDL